MKSLAAMSTAVLFGLVALGCNKVSASGDGERVARPKHYVVIFDLSASRATEMLSEDKQFVDQLIQRLTFGDRLTLLQMQQVGLSDHPMRWNVTMPSPKDPTFPTSRDRGQLAAAVRGVKSALPTFFETKDTIKVIHTDIFSTMHLATEYTQDSVG